MAPEMRGTSVRIPPSLMATARDKALTNDPDSVIIRAALLLFAESPSIVRDAALARGRAMAARPGRPRKRAGLPGE